MKYRKGYKYQLWEDEYYPIGIYGKAIKSDYLELLPNGIMICRKGYAWDGASGGPNGMITVDTKSSMRGSLFHDGGYQFLRERCLPLDHKEIFDKVFYDILLQDKMLPPRAWGWYQAVKYFGKSATLPKNDKPILEAP